MYKIEENYIPSEHNITGISSFNNYRQSDNVISDDYYFMKDIKKNSCESFLVYKKFEDICKRAILKRCHRLMFYGHSV